MWLSALSAQNESVQEGAATGIPSNGIIGAGEVMDSPLLQTHGNRERDPVTDILSTYFLRDYVTAQVEGLKHIGSQQDSFLPWALPLSSHFRSVGTEVKIVRYNLERKKVPRYKYDYKYVKRTTYVREGGSTETPSSGSGYDQEKRKRPGKLVERTVMERELVSVKLVGYKTEEVRVYHPEGKYEEEMHVSIVRSQGVARLMPGWHAGNAQVAYSMLKAGLPASDPQFKLFLQSMHNMLYAYGIPDYTQDVAWLTALYANLPQDDPAVKEWCGKLISKLVAGAAQHGQNKGLWGPVCINAEYLNEIYDFDTKYAAKYLTPLQNEIAIEQRERSKQRLQEKLAESESIYEKWQRVYMTWAMAGNTAEFARAETTIPSDADGQQNFIFSYSLQVPGLVHDAYHFEFTDIESTCIALMALSEASAAGILPAVTLTPADERGKSLAKSLDVKGQLATCYQSLKQLRLSTGGWDSCYSAFYHKKCRDISYNSIIPQDAYHAIKSETHWAYNVMGQTSMEYLARIIGGDAGLRIRKETADYQVSLVQWLLENLEELALRYPPARDNLTYFLADMIGSGSPDARFLWQKIGVMALREPEYIANLDLKESYNGFAATMALKTEQELFQGNKLVPLELELEPSANPALRETMQLNRLNVLGNRAALTYFLTKGIRQPVFAAVKPASSQGVCPALEYFVNKKSATMPLNYFYVSASDAIAQYCTSLFLLVEQKGDTAFTISEKENFTKYISQHAGTVVVLGLPGQSSALMEKEIATMLDGAGLTYRKEDSTKRGGRCIEFLVEERLVAVIADASTDKEVKETYSKRLKLYQSLMEQKLPPNYAKKDYCLLPERVSNGELTMTGIDWEVEEK